MVLLAPASPISASSRLDDRTQQAMIDAINDEYQARAFYTAVIEKYGNVRPFSNIVQAEERHAQRWYTLFARYGLSVPEDTFAGNVEAPETLQAACEMAVAAEIANVQMYDSFLEFVKEPDLRATFTQLRNVSQNNHKPAFERCVSRLAGREPGYVSIIGKGGCSRWV
ncbi:hypothetical protein N836_32595 [Leptolyngbya sp. Heron Island J]|uniref:ferritin-like domain-containing protein n=1 Tax=Leptolyngbya sp. Heron Island J TaxID=1385935 RepID=UPI0003B97C75|nr:ferritin family protein [Leptolyngbya sp. Heron Island J]ESA38171.1 hypothetical protein N836_32595 [Leptolyngbya sp. Heron Island J]